MERKIVPFEVKATSGDGSTGEGIGNAFHLIDSYGEIVAPGAFTDTLAQFLAQGFMGGVNHDWDNPIGRFTAAEEVAKGLKVAWAISDTAHGRDVKTLLKDGVIKKLSIGFRTLGREILETAKDVADYWQKHNYTPTAEDVAASQFGARLLTKIHLYEVSPVTVPANRDSDITRVKAYKPDDFQKLSDVEDFLRDVAAFSHKDSKAFIARFRTLLRDAGSTEEPTLTPEPTYAALKAEAMRQRARILSGDHHAELSRLYRAG